MGIYLSSVDSARINIDGINKGNSNMKLLMRFIVSLYFLLQSFVIQAAAPVTHAVMAEKWMEHKEHFNKNQKRAFMLGTLFPDIRYLGVISRKETHEKDLALADVEKKISPFLKGKRLHAWVDEFRENRVVKWHIYAKIKNVAGQQYKHTFLKLLEDEILFSEKNWADVRADLKTYAREEKKSGISMQALKRWHHALDASFEDPPSVRLAHLSQLETSYAGVPHKIIKAWSKELPKYAARKDMRAYVKRLMAEFDKEIEK